MIHRVPLTGWQCFRSGVKLPHPRGLSLKHPSKARLTYHYTQKDDQINSKIISVRYFLQGLSNVPWRKRAFWPGSKYFFLDLILGILGTLFMGRGRPWHGTSAQPERYFICSSPTYAFRVVPSTFLLNYF